MDLESLKDKKIAVLGFGQEGQAVLSYLRKHNLKATILEEKLQSEWTEAQKNIVIDIDDNLIISGPEYLNNLEQFEVIFRSPGIWRKTPQILEAESNGSIITSQAKWFFDNCLAVKNIIGVTGTKGKGTTCSLITEILKVSGQTVYLTGNIGKIQPLDILDQINPNDWVVYELSSFQLQDLKVSPHIGICLMVTSDHLNHHADIDEYHFAKSAITTFQTAEDIAISNIDYEASKQIGLMGGGKKFKISAKEPVQLGAFINLEKNQIEITQEDNEKIIIDCSERMLRGDHNLENIAPAVLATLSAGINLTAITEGIKSFPGLEHRLQFVGTINDATFYNDSISTVPETALAAVNSFTEPIHLFLGGSNKGLDYSALIADLGKKKNIASIILLGETGEIIKQEIAKQNITIPTFGPYSDFNQAFQEVVGRAKAGDVVLLSPASASFDMFENYADRGHKFVNLVNQYQT